MINWCFRVLMNIFSSYNDDGGCGLPLLSVIQQSNIKITAVKNGHQPIHFKFGLLTYKERFYLYLFPFGLFSDRNFGIKALIGNSGVTRPPGTRVRHLLIYKFANDHHWQMPLTAGGEILSEYFFNPLLNDFLFFS